MKRFIRILTACLLAIPQAQAQSLADAARKEAERRRQLAEQGVEGKVIEANGSGQRSTGSLTTFNPGAGQSARPGTVKEAKNRASLSTYRNQLRKLDREILECEERQSLLRRQAEAERWSLPKSGRRGGAAGSESPREKLLRQAEELEARLKRLRRQRLEVREDARKAGYLPGEIDGKAVAP